MGAVLARNQSTLNIQLRFVLVVLITSFLCDLALNELLPTRSFQSQVLDAFLTGCFILAGLWIFGLRAILLLRKRVLDAEQALNSSNDGYWILDKKGTIVHVNDAYCELIGYSREQLLSMQIADLERRATQEQIQQQIGRILWSGDERFETQHRHANGTWIDLEITVTAIDNKHAVAYLRNITLKKAAEKKIQQLAYTDSITGLANRNYFDKYLAEIDPFEIDQGFAAVLLLDLDNFKLFNDTRGHAEGDKLLHQVASSFRGQLPAGNVAFRLGGDEFAIILKDLNKDMNKAADTAFEIAEKIRESIEDVITTGDIKFKLSASIGIAIGKIHQDTLENLLKKADIALYRAKGSGRNQCYLFKKHMQIELERKARLETDLQSAIAKYQFIPFLQPQYDDTQRVIGAEILLRWAHPELGFIRPVDFIPIAEDSRAIIEIGNWLLEYACQQILAWQSHPMTRDLQLAVNVSVVQFEHATFVNTIEKLLGKYTFDHKLLTLELTESVALSNIDKAIEKMNLLRQLGLSISLDDFGTGHSSLSNIRNLPLNQLKIDKSFINNMQKEPKDVAVARCIVSIGRELGMEVIAEGVETEYQRALLESLGCYLFQGFLYSPPVPLADFETIVHEANSQEA